MKDLGEEIEELLDIERLGHVGARAGREQAVDLRPHGVGADHDDGGAQPPTPDWGAMLADGRAFITVASHVATVPGLAIFLAVLGLNVLGEGLREILDPRST